MSDPNVVMPRPLNVNYPTPPGNPGTWETSPAVSQPTHAYLLHSFNAKLASIANALTAFITAESADDAEAEQQREQALTQLAALQIQFNSESQREAAEDAAEAQRDAEQTALIQTIQAGDPAEIADLISAHVAPNVAAKVGELLGRTRLTVDDAPLP